MQLEKHEPEIDTSSTRAETTRIWNTKVLLNTERVRNLLIAYFVCLLILAYFMASSKDFIHWFIIPVLACGVVIGSDAVSWILTEESIFDPAGIIGVLGFHFFFFAPLLHISTDFWMSYVTPPSDWRPWLGRMAILNLIGLLIYRFVREIKPSKTSKEKRVWTIDERIFPVVIIAGLAITAVIQIMVYRQQGGILGYIQAYEVRYEEQTFKGMGWIFMISESFPILAFMGLAFWARKRPYAKTWGSLLLVLIIFFILQILFGGLRGSRSNTIWKIFWAAGIVHFWLRPFSKRLMYAGIVFVIAFMYIYGFYKGAGTDITKLLSGTSGRIELENETSRSIEATLLGDLARSDIQAFLLYRLANSQSDYEYAWGRTYAGAVSILIPRSIWPDRPINKVKEGTQIQYGMNAYPARNSSRIYGLSGEAMLNFGVLAIPFAFVLFSLVIRKVRLWFSAWTAKDARWLLAPYLVNLCFLILTADSDNIVFFLIKNGAVPIFTVVISSRISTISNGN